MVGLATDSNLGWFGCGLPEKSVVSVVVGCINQSYLPLYKLSLYCSQQLLGPRRLGFKESVV